MMKKESSSLFWKSGLITLLLLVVLGLLPIRQVLIARNFRTKKILRIWQQDDFTVSYTHSVMRSPVTESYYIKDGKIFLKESSFKDYGAGLPSSTDYDFKMEDGLFVIYNIDKALEPLVYRTGAELAHHKLIIGGQEQEFLSFSQPREDVEFVAKKVNNLVYLLKRERRIRNEY